MFNAIKKAMETSDGGSFGIRTGRKVERLPLLAFRETVNAYNAVIGGCTYETIDEQVARVCRHYGIPCRESGIGWVLG